MEGAVGNVLPSEADADHVLAGLRRRVEDVERAVLVLHHVHVQLHPLGGAHAARDLALPGRLGVDRDDRLLADLDGRTDAGSFKINI